MRETERRKTYDEGRYGVEATVRMRRLVRKTLSIPLVHASFHQVFSHVNGITMVYVTIDVHRYNTDQTILKCVVATENVVMRI